MKRKSVVLGLIGLAMGGVFADGNFNYYSVKMTSDLAEPIPLPSKEFLDNDLYVKATNRTFAVWKVAYILDTIGYSIRKFPNAYKQQEVEAYAFHCLTNTLSIPDSVEWTIDCGGDFKRKELIQSTFLSNDVVATNREAICYLADYIGSIPVIVIDLQVAIKEYAKAEALDKEQGYPECKGPAFKAICEKWRMLEWQAPFWRRCRKCYLKIVEDGLVPKWKSTFSPEDFATVKSNFIERAHLTPVEVKSVFGR